MNQKLRFLFLILWGHTAFCQDLSFQWGIQTGHILGDVSKSVVTDQNNDIITVGQYKGTVDFDPNSGINSLTSQGNDDVYIQKLDEDKNFIWAVGIGTPTSTISAKSIATDANNNIYVAGWFNDTVDFDPDPSASFFMNSAVNNANVFIVKLNSAGQFIWAKNAGTNTSSAYSVTVDSQNNVYLAGHFGGTADFDPGTGTTMITASGPSDIFVMKLTESGQFVWAHGFGGSALDYGLTMTCDSNADLYISGFFQNSVDFDPGPGTNTLTSNGNFDCFLLKLDSAGQFNWANSFGSSSQDYGNSLTFDSNNNVYLTGEFSGTTDFNPGSGTFNLSPMGGSSVFVVKLDANGSFLWANAIDASFDNSDGKIVCDLMDNVYLTGSFNGTVDFDPGAGTENLTAFGSFDAFIQKTDPFGNLIWAKPVGGTSEDHGNGIAIDQTNHAYVTGSFQGLADLDPGNGIFLINSSGLNDAFTIKLKPCTHSSSDISLVVCNDTSVISPSGKIWMTDGIHMDTITNQSGCDSIMTFDITFTHLDTTISLDGITIISNEPNAATYQWVDCTNNNAPVPGATDQSFTPTENGIYAVTIGNGNCEYTSICVAIVNIGLDESNIFVPEFFPNPATDQITFYTGNEFTESNIEILDISGKKVLTYNGVSNGQVLSVNVLSPGIYFIKQAHNNQLYTLIKQ